MDDEGLIRNLKRFGALAAGIGAGTIVPAWSYFANNAPPFFGGSTVIVSALAAAVILGVAVLVPKPPRSLAERRRTVFRGWACLAGSVLTLLLYTVLLEVSTVSSPRDGERTQIGFGMARWNLRADAIDWLAEYGDRSVTSFELMMARGGFGEGGVAKSWATWAVSLAGSLLVLLFLATAMLWSFGWALLARSIPPPPASKPGTIPTDPEAG